jgi:hypothetical protein
MIYDLCDFCRLVMLLRWFTKQYRERPDLVKVGGGVFTHKTHQVGATHPSPNMLSATILSSASVGNGGREVKLHPLVLINISDHFTRERVRDTTSELYSSSERVAGVLFGVQTGKVVDVLESFEMSYEILDTGVLKFDEQFLSSKKRQCKLFGNVADRAQDVFLVCL